MHPRRIANLWILLLVGAGLLLAPVAPAFARLMPGDAAASMQMMAGEMQADTRVMSEDMPCCPDQTQSKTCDGCPFVALCMLSVPLPVPTGAVTLIERHPLRSQFAAHDDLLLDGLGAKPPDHPPRSNV
ncbi:hypothetical protein JQ615_17930 [Bradyrhizobium jicamae]|uniref:DUF2946 domain-containing protein n=1 Tax=Bradyrhizobium jicamae TaxID=280332 RepID=A0ABS5FKF8_9BRAD|nr:hypothetical protein [Bradyrhizobium jicamae]MBR0797273.1 hypothetical protein [Bradyrhizobium jicamae]